MRIGLIGDVHANLHALRAALARLRAEGVDAWVCVGDLVGYGPHPNECVETIADLGSTCVAGNHELMLLDELPQTRAGRLARISLAWTNEVVRPDVRAHLATLPRTARLDDLAIAHGSPHDPEEYVRTEARAAALLEELPAARLLLLGHTHHPWLYGSDAGTAFPTSSPPGSAEVPLRGPGRYLVNPGAVGQSRERERRPLARFALLDLDRETVCYFAEPYDDGGTRTALRAHRLPAYSVHVRPGKVAGAQRRARRLLGRAWGTVRHQPGT